VTLSTAQRIYSSAGRALRPRKTMTVSELADAERNLSAKESPRPGKWRTSAVPALREPMDCMSKGTGINRVVLVFPIQYGKTAVMLNGLFYTMVHDQCPVMVVLPDDLTKDAWILQKFNPMVEESQALRDALTSTASRDSANQRAFKDFKGGQLFIEHGKTATRLALRTVKRIFVDEIDKFAGELTTGEDPLELIKGRASAFPTTYLHCFIGSPGLKGISRLDALYLESDQRRFHVPCPHCDVLQPLEWKGLHWPDGRVFYACRENGCVIEERHKTQMLARGVWIAGNPGAKTRGYHLNALYYSIGMGPSWPDLVDMWIKAQSDPAKLQVFVQERLAESWEDPSMRAVKHNLLVDRAEPYLLRIAPHGVLWITVGVDTQDNRLAVHIVGWGRNLKAWTIDYIELPGDPAEEAVWIALTDLLNRPIEHESGFAMPISAVAIDMMGHRTEAVKHYVRRRLVRRPMCIFGATNNNAPALGKAKLVDVTWKGQTDKRALQIYPVGTVAIKHHLYSRIGADADTKKVGDEVVPKTAVDRFIHLSDQLAPQFFAGLVSETYNAAKNRFEKRTGVRNEPLDTWVYAYAAAHHPELRLHRRTRAEWDADEARQREKVEKAQKGKVPHETKDRDTAQQQAVERAAKPGRSARKPGRRNFATTW
jgi:phage terminase large subunit GpA-like protein